MDKFYEVTVLDIHTQKLSMFKKKIYKTNTCMAECIFNKKKNPKQFLRNKYDICACLSISNKHFVFMQI